MSFRTAWHKVVPEESMNGEVKPGKITGFRQTFRVRSSLDITQVEIRNAFDPNSTWIMMWQQFLLVLMLYEFLLIPFVLVFEPHEVIEMPYEIVAFYACEAFFLVDVYVQLNTGFYEDGTIVLDVRKARKKYFHSQVFWIDIFALIPWSHVFMWMVHLPFSPIWLEFHKFLRLGRLSVYMLVLDNMYSRQFALMKLLRVLLVTFFLSHAVACVRFAFGFDRAHDNHWLPKKPPVNAVHYNYIMSFFWAFGLLTGLFEGELPHHILEFLFTVFVALCGFSLFTYLCATLFMLSKCESGSSETADARINQLKHLLSFHQVPSELQAQAIGYLKRYYTSAESNDREAMRLLCPSIAKDIRVELLKDVVAQIPLFHNCSEQFIIAITSLLELIALPAQVTVFQVGDSGDAMYVVSSGVLHILVNGVKMRELRKGNFFGEVSVFSDRPRSATVVTTTYCTLYRLTRFHTERIMDAYPQYAILIEKTVDEMVSNLAPITPRKASVVDPDPTIPHIMSSMSNAEKIQLRRCLSDSALRSMVLRTSSSFAGRRPSLQMAGAKPAPTDPAAAAPPGSPTTSTAAGAPSTNRRPIPVLTRTPTGPIRLVRRTIGPLTRKSTLMRRRPTKIAPEGEAKVDAPIEPVHPDIFRGFYDRLIAPHSKDTTRKWYTRLLLKRCIDSESKWRMWWIFLLQVILGYYWLIIPLQLSFSVYTNPSWLVIGITALADVMLWVDLYLNFNLGYVDSAEKILDTMQSAKNYLKGPFLLDLLCALPYNWLVTDTYRSVYARVPRLLRVWRAYGHFREADEYLHFNSRSRLYIFGVSLLMLYHLVACLYFSITYIEGFSKAEESWIPSEDIYLRDGPNNTFINSAEEAFPADSRYISIIAHQQYLRSLYWAAHVMTGLGKTVEPSSERQYYVALLFMVSGFLITAIVVDNVQKRFTASAFEQKEFFATRSRIQLFLRRQNAPLAILQRVNSFLDFWWSSHRGALIDELLAELPPSIKRDISRSICSPALQALGLLLGVRPVLQALEVVFIDNAKFILFGQGEIVYNIGDYANGVYFLLEGDVIVTTNETPPRGVGQGGFFGTAALRDDDTTTWFKEQVVATKGCILLFVSREHIQALQKVFPTFCLALTELEVRMTRPNVLKLVRPLTVLTLKRVSPGSHVHGRDTKNTWLFRWCGVDERSFDPDSRYISAWETLTFLALTAQWVLVTFHICFGVTSRTQAIKVDTMTMLLETIFVIDIYVCSRLGFYSFGNKVLDMRVIRPAYFRSTQFFIDVMAVFPLFMINWMIPFNQRSELFNLNKLLRLFKVPSRFRSLEAKYLKKTFEMRVFKLVYYCFLLSHVFGCMWFDFANHSSGLIVSQSVSPNTTKAFGAYPWLPMDYLENAGRNVQYTASLFWSFALMSASQTGELPKTASQCFFSVVTMTVGFFLFAYVVGNLSDVIELLDAENREFHGKLSSLRQLLAHFRLPNHLEDRFKTYFFFKRFHTITQEHILEKCLPPSLVTDIRLIQLQSMLVKVAFLAGMEASVTRMLVGHLSQVMVLKDQYVCRFGDEGNEMFFIYTGIVEILVPAEKIRIALRPIGSTNSEKNQSHRSERSERIHSIVAATVALAAANAVASGGQNASPPLRSSMIGKTIDQQLLKQQQQLQQRAAGPKEVELKKVNEITSGNYFGESALFTNTRRNASVRAKTSCILYKLSRQSLDMVFDRYPQWKQKVLRIVKIQQEQLRLRHMALEEMTGPTPQAIGTTPLTPTAAPLEPPMRNKSSNHKLTIAKLFAGSTRSKLVENALAKPKPLKRPWSKLRRLTAEGMVTQQQQQLMAVMKPPLYRRVWLSLKQFKQMYSDYLQDGIKAQEPLHLFWMKLMLGTTLYMLMVVPYRIAFDSMERLTTFTIVVRVLELCGELLFAADILVNWNISDSVSSLELYEQDHLLTYRKERFLYDAIAAFPLDHLLSSFFNNGWFRLTRCVKALNLSHYINEIHRFSVSYEKNRLLVIWLMYLLAIYWSACAYYVIADFDKTNGYGSEQDWQMWSPSSNLTIDGSKVNFGIQRLAVRLLRGIFFGTTAFVKKGRTFVPTTTVHYIFAIFVCFIGQLTMGFMIGEIANVFISYIGNEVEFRKNHISVQLFLSRKNVSNGLKKRAHAFLSSLWSSHKGVDYQNLFEEVPVAIRADAVSFIANSSLTSFGDFVFQRITPDDLTTLPQVVKALAQNLRFEGYPRDENVIVEGSISKAMYFVVKGNLFVHDKTSTRMGDAGYFRKGDFFGEKGLLGYSVSAFSVRTVRACDLFSLSCEDLLSVIQANNTLRMALLIAEEAVQEMLYIEVKRPRTRAIWGEVLQKVVIQHRLMGVFLQSEHQDWWNGFAQDPMDALMAFEPLLQLLVPLGSLYETEKPIIRRRSSLRKDQMDRGLLARSERESTGLFPLRESSARDKSCESIWPRRSSAMPKSQQNSEADSPGAQTRRSISGPPTRKRSSCLNPIAVPPVHPNRVESIDMKTPPTTTTHVDASGAPVQRKSLIKQMMEAAEAAAGPPPKEVANLQAEIDKIDLPAPPADEVIETTDQASVAVALDSPT